MPAFNGDICIESEVKKLRQKYDIQLAIETGTHKGETTKVLSKIFPIVHTIEINQNYYNSCYPVLREIKNIIMHYGNSPDIMKNIFMGISSNNITKKISVFFYLDAHWYGYNPLLDELKTIAEYKYFIIPIIAIHDFKVPNKDFGYDKFPNGKDYTYNNIQKEVNLIYTKGNVHYYNDKTSGSNRGIIYIIPAVK